MFISVSTSPIKYNHLNPSTTTNIIEEDSNLEKKGHFILRLALVEKNHSDGPGLFFDAPQGYIVTLR